MGSLLILLAIIAAVALWAVSIYNRLINERNRVKDIVATCLPVIVEPDGEVIKRSEQWCKISADEVK